MSLKPKSVAVLDTLLNDPKISATDAYLKHHQTASRRTAGENAHQLLKKTEAQLYLNKHINKARNKVVTLVDSEKEDIALRASDSILDRALGKATQRTESISTVVTLGLNLHDISK